MPQIKREWVDEIIFVDCNSTDGTPEWLQAHGYRVITQKSRGLALAYWECFDAMSGDVIIVFTPDGNSMPETIPALVAKMKEGYDLVIASRYLGDAKSEDDDLITGFGNWMFTRMMNLLYGTRYTDVLVSYRAFKISLVKTLNLTRSQHPFLEQELMVRAYQLEGTEELVATSARPFPMPSTSHLLPGSSSQAWMATKGRLSMYGVNRRSGGQSMFLVADMPMAEMPQLAARLDLI